MIRNKLFIILVLTLIACNSKPPSQNNPLLNDFIAELEGKSLKEIEEEFDTSIKQIEKFTTFFSSSFANKIKFIEKEDERYEPLFEVDTTGVNKALHQFNGVVFRQTFNAYQSDLEFEFKDDDFRRPLSLDKNILESYIPNAIYYTDGEVKTDSIANYEVDFSFDREWGKTKSIDSISITYRLDYLKTYDSIELSTDNPKANYKGKEIKLVKMQDNYAYITFSDSITSSPREIQGYSIEGKILEGSGSSKYTIAPQKTKRIFTEMLEYSKKVQQKLKNDDFENTAELKEYINKKFNSLDFFNDNDGVYHREYYYKGNVNSIKLYFPKDTEVLQTEFIAYNTQSFFNDDELFEMQTENGLVFLNSKGETKITIPKNQDIITKIGSDFYEDDNYFYHLNRSKKELDTLFVYDIEAFNNGVIGIKPESFDNDFSLFASDNSPISNKKYSELQEIGNLLVGIRNEQYYIIDNQGKETLLVGVTKVYDGPLYDNRIMAESQNGIGFITSKGEVAIPFQYTNARNFKDGFTVVKFDDTYKFIDVNGKVLVDTKEDYLNTLDKDEQGKRIYRFSYGKKRYNYKGEIIKNENLK